MKTEVPRSMISFLDKYIVWWKYIIDIIEVWLCFFSFMHSLFTFMEIFFVTKITVLQRQINLFICLLFLQFSASVELGIQEGYLSANQKSELVRDVCTSINHFTSHPKRSERQWIAKKIVEEYPCMAGKKLVDSDTEWVSKF